MFGTHGQGVSCRFITYIIVLYQLPNFISSQCGNDTYYSHDLEGCLDCPDIPSIDCRDVHQSDIKSCLQNCISITGNYFNYWLKYSLTIIYYSLCIERILASCAVYRYINRNRIALLVDPHCIISLLILEYVIEYKHG